MFSFESPHRGNYNEHTQFTYQYISLYAIVENPLSSATQSNRDMGKYSIGDKLSNSNSNSLLHLGLQCVNNKRSI